MGRKKMSMSSRIRAYERIHPNAKPAEVAKALGVKATLVYAVHKYDNSKGVAPNNVTPASVVAEAVQLPGVNIDAVHATAPPAADMVNKPPHYMAGGIETIDFIQAKLTREEYIGYLKGNAIKYGSRMAMKGSPDTDAGKMAWYASRLREVYAPK